MFHGTAPNTSSTCRMAQFLKAFSRSKSFPTKVESGQKGRSGEAVVECDGCCKESALSRCVPVPSRLIRRAAAVERELQISGSLSCVTPLGRVLFGLDVLDEEIPPTGTVAADSDMIENQKLS